METSFSFTGFVVVCTVTSHVLVGPVVIYKKRELKQSANPEASGGRYNNVRSNANLSNGMINIAIVSCFILVGSMVSLVDWKENAFVPVLSWYMMGSIMVSIIFPAKLIRKPEIRQHIKAHLL